MCECRISMQIVGFSMQIINKYYLKLPFCLKNNIFICTFHKKVLTLRRKTIKYTYNVSATRKYAANGFSYIWGGGIRGNQVANLKI